MFSLQLINKFEKNVLVLSAKKILTHFQDKILANLKIIVFLQQLCYFSNTSMGYLKPSYFLTILQYANNIL